jgi:predicted metalloprotease
VDAYEEFAATVLGSANAYWSTTLAAEGATYEEPQLVLFRGSTQSACGGAAAVAGPHYCPLDERIYLDETFFAELAARFGADAGDVAQAYVIAHEVGHHVQHELGLLGGERGNEASIETELVADCLAGSWLGTLTSVLEEGEIREALSAASAVGDDNIQEQTSGTVRPESWTHGSSAERTAALLTGYRDPGLESCFE